jgi:hypothetical protein
MRLDSRSDAENSFGSVNSIHENAHVFGQKRAKDHPSTLNTVTECPTLRENVLYCVGFILHHLVFQNLVQNASDEHGPG